MWKLEFIPTNLKPTTLHEVGGDSQLRIDIGPSLRLLGAWWTAQCRLTSMHTATRASGHNLHIRGWNRRGLIAVCTAKLLTATPSSAMTTSAATKSSACWDPPRQHMHDGVPVRVLYSPDCVPVCVLYDGGSVLCSACVTRLLGSLWLPRISGFWRFKALLRD